MTEVNISKHQIVSAQYKLTSIKGNVKKNIFVGLFTRDTKFRFVK